MMFENAEIVKNMRNRTTKLEREGDYWEDHEKDTLRRLFADGMGVTNIAILLQRTEPAVFQQIEKMDLYRRSEMPQRRKTSKHYKCRCDTCKAPQEVCPLCERSLTAQEVE